LLLRLAAAAAGVRGARAGGDGHRAQRPEGAARPAAAAADLAALAALAQSPGGVHAVPLGAELPRGGGAAVRPRARAEQPRPVRPRRVAALQARRAALVRQHAAPAERL